MERDPSLKMAAPTEGNTQGPAAAAFESGASVNSRNEALEFIDKHRDLLEHYARGAVHFKPAPVELPTFAFDLKKDDIYLHPRFYQEKGLSDEKTTFATFHEVEHFLEKKALLSEPGGDKAFASYLKRLKASEAWKLMDNCVADVRENRAVVAKTNPGYRELEQSAYKDDLFKETDFTAAPRHIQFTQAILREARVPDQVCTVAPEVREKLDALKNLKTEDGQSLFDLMTDPSVPMSTRLELQDEYVWPSVKELLDKDMEDEKKRQEEESREKSRNAIPQNRAKREMEKGEGSGGQDEKDDQGKSGGSKSQPGKPDKSEKGASGKPRVGDVSGKSGASEKPDKFGKPGGGRPEKLDPDEVFKSAYEEAARRMPNAVPVEEIEKAFKEWCEANSGNPMDKADAEYAEKLGVKKEDLQNYRRIVESVNGVVDHETNMTAVQELRRLINRIIAHRLKPAVAPRYPTEEGDDLVDPSELVTRVKAGDLEPKAWESIETKEKRSERAGEVEITLVFDRSGSMDDDGGRKRIEQQKAGVMAMEALKEFGDLCEEERFNVVKPLEVRSEAYSFQAADEDSTPLKAMSKELSEKDRIAVCGRLSSRPGGGTTDFVPLETIVAGISRDREYAEKIKSGEVKKIVIVMTDGGSDDVTRVGRALETLRSAGVVVAGIGITEAGRAALTTYAPEARLAETAEKLPVVLADVLKEHLAEV